MNRDHLSTWFNKKRLLWFSGERIFVDARVWAQCYNLPNDQEKIIEHIIKRVGKVEIVGLKKEDAEDEPILF